MDDPYILTQRLAALFRETCRAHHQAQAFTQTASEDPEWPLWYADYLQAKLGKLLSAKFTKSELVYLLVTAAGEQALNAPGANWAQYYARFFVRRYV
jgi:hypothetical protein